MSAGMAGVIAAHVLWEYGEPETSWSPGESVAQCSCGVEHGGWVHTAGGEECPDWDKEHAAHIAEELAKAGYGNVQVAKAESLTDAADWLVNGEAAGIIAYDGPSNRGEVMAAYDAALEDPEGWLRERAEAALTVDPADLYREERDGMAEAWREGRAASPDTLNPYEDWPSTPDPLAAALADPEGHALVKAIRDRKAGA